MNDQVSLGTASDVRGVLIPVTGGQVVLPNATVAEVITFGNPREIEGAPPWVIGALTWRGWRIPLFSLSILSGQTAEENMTGAKVAVIKGLGGNPRLPFLALVAQGFPRLTTLRPDNLNVLEGEETPAGVASIVSINDERAFLPDLDAIEGLLQEAM